MTNSGSNEAGGFRESTLLTLPELCAWLNISERHARKLVERNVIPYRKVGHLLRFSREEVESWSRPPGHRAMHLPEDVVPDVEIGRRPVKARKCSQVLPKSLLE